MRFLICTLMLLALSWNTSLQAQCGSAEGFTTLDINAVRAGLLTSGDLWWNGIDAVYEISTGTGVDPDAMFAGALWIGGVDAGGQLRMAAQTYRQSGNDFWPGPLDASTGDAVPGHCEAFDRHWKVDLADIEAHRLLSPPIALSDIPASILEWPGQVRSQPDYSG